MQQYVNDVDVNVLAGDHMISEEANEKSSPGASRADKNLQKMSRQLINQPVNCPWTSRAPITIAGGLKNALPEDRTFTEKLFSHNNQSSSQFFHFLRLMQLFPDVHPATLHTVMVLCKNDFFTAVDRLLYAKRYKNFLIQRRNFWTTFDTNQLSLSAPANPQCQHELHSIACVSNIKSEKEVHLTRPEKLNENRYRSRAPEGTDLPLKVTAQYTVPISPLSPMLNQNDHKFSN